MIRTCKFDNRLNKLVRRGKKDLLYSATEHYGYIRHRYIIYIFILFRCLCSLCLRSVHNWVILFRRTDTHADEPDRMHVPAALSQRNKLGSTVRRKPSPNSLQCLTGRKDYYNWFVSFTTGAEC